MMGRDASTPKPRFEEERRPHPDLPSVSLLRPEAKTAWLEALRSGRFQQGRSKLAWDIGDGMQFCCLGVLCEVAIEAGVEVNRQERGTARVEGQDPVRYMSYDGNTSLPPDSVLDWAWGTDQGTMQVVASHPKWDDETIEVTEPVDLAYLNDTEEKSFEEIADAIEETL